MLLCTAYLTATLVSLGVSGFTDKPETERKPMLCPLIDAPLAVVSLPQMQTTFDRFAVSFSKSFYASLLYAAACPSPASCKLVMPQAEQRQ